MNNLLPRTLNLSAPTTTSLSSAENSNFPERVFTSNFWLCASTAWGPRGKKLYFREKYKKITQ